jgi:hypothetical protein
MLNPRAPTAKPGHVIFFLTIITMALIAPATAMSASQLTFYVANNGANAPDCGLSRSAPCRSINHTVSIAPAGSRIVVGPGRYGDVNGDGVLQGPDEEEPCRSDASMLCVKKRLTLESSSGPHATVIDAGGTGGLGWTVVYLGADGIVFGGRDKGFTVTGGSFGGLVIGGLGGSADVSVIGNLFYNNSQVGLAVAGVPPGRTVIADNDIRDCGSAAFIVNGDGGGTVIVDHNTATNSETGFRIAFFGQQIMRNKATGNNIGFAINAHIAFLSDNIAVGNRIGILARAFERDVQYLTRNTVTGNFGNGIQYDEAGGTFKLHGNNIFGNGGFGLLAGSENVDATNNWWGSPSGPGSDPADAISGAGIRAVPFSTHAFTTAN